MRAHSDLRELESHPWRLQDPTHAKLFLVPAYIGTSVRGVCNGTDMNHPKRMNSLAKFLRKSPYYQKYVVWVFICSITNHYIL
jgi:hypothetical protein